MSIQTISYYCFVSYCVPVIALVVSRPNPVVFFFPSSFLFLGPNGLLTRFAVIIIIPIIIIISSYFGACVRACLLGWLRPFRFVPGRLSLNCYYYLFSTSGYFHLLLLLRTHIKLQWFALVAPLFPNVQQSPRLCRPSSSGPISSTSSAVVST